MSGGDASSAESGKDEAILAALPFHVWVNSDSDVTISRGAISFKLEGEDVLILLRSLCERIAGEALTREELLEAIAPGDRADAESLITLCLDHNIFVEDDTYIYDPSSIESPLDIFHWHFRESEFNKPSRDVLNEIVVVGLNPISAAIADLLRDEKNVSLKIVDDPFLRRDGFDHWSFEQATDANAWGSGRADQSSIVVACADSGSASILREWNFFCVRKSLRFMPVLLQSMIGLVGPLIVPGETACFECAARRDFRYECSPLHDLDTLESEAHKGSLSAYHPAMSSAVASIAAMEIIKYLNNAPVFTSGVLFDVNLMRPALVSRRILKLPGCPVCSDTNTQPHANPVKADFYG